VAILQSRKSKLVELATETNQPSLDEKSGNELLDLQEEIHLNKKWAMKQAAHLASIEIHKVIAAA
jgi:hypothetical protein